MEPQRKRIKTEHVELNRAEVKLEEEDGEEPEVVNIEEPEVVNYNYAVKPKNALWVWPDVKVVDDEGYEYETVQFGDTERFQRILTESTSSEDLPCDLEWIDDEDRVEQRSDDGKWRRWPQEYCIEWEALPESKDSGIWWPSIDPRGSIRVREHWYCNVNCIIGSEYPWVRCVAAERCEADDELIEDEEKEKNDAEKE